MKLYLALGIASGDVAAFVGAGGKSSAMLTVADELAQAGMKVLVAPTTKMLVSEAQRIGPLVTSEDAGELRMKAEEASPTRPRGRGRQRVALQEPRRRRGASRHTFLAPLADVVLVEADGAAAPDQRHSRSRARPAATLVVAVGSTRLRRTRRPGTRPPPRALLQADRRRRRPEHNRSRLRPGMAKGPP